MRYLIFRKHVFLDQFRLEGKQGGFSEPQVSVGLRNNFQYVAQAYTELAWLVPCWFCK